MHFQKKIYYFYIDNSNFNTNNLITETAGAIVLIKMGEGEAYPYRTSFFSLSLLSFSPSHSLPINAAHQFVCVGHLNWDTLNTKINLTTINNWFDGFPFTALTMQEIRQGNKLLFDLRF